MDVPTIGIVVWMGTFASAPCGGELDRDGVAREALNMTGWCFDCDQLATECGADLEDDDVSAICAQIAIEEGWI